MCQGFETPSWGPNWKSRRGLELFMTGHRVGAWGASGQNRPGRQSSFAPHSAQAEQWRRSANWNPPVAGQAAVAPFKRNPVAPCSVASCRVGRPSIEAGVRTSWLTSASTE